MAAVHTLLPYWVCRPAMAHRHGVNALTFGRCAVIRRRVQVDREGRGLVQAEVYPSDRSWSESWLCSELCGGFYTSPFTLRDLFSMPAFYGV